MINVTKAYLPNKAKLYSYFDKIYDSAWLTNNGPFCKDLEKRLKEYLGVRNLILVSNGTLALQIAYKALDIKGSAITTPFSFVATASSLVWEGIKPIFADIGERSWNISPAEIENKIKPDTSAIVPVHVFGNGCEVEAIKDIADRAKLKVIYDGAHAFGIRYKGESLLKWGDITTVSFHATKLFHTIEGGAIVTENDQIAQKIRLLANFGTNGPDKIETLGINSKMNEFQAAMGLCVLDDIEQISDGRKKVWEFYRCNLPESLLKQEWNHNCSQNYHYYPVVFQSESDLLKTVKALNESQIFPRRYFYPSLDTLNYLDHHDSLPVSRDIAQRILCLPIFPNLSRLEQEEIVSLVIKNVAPKAHREIPA